MKPVFILKNIITSLGLLVLLTPSQASAQIVPQPWVSVGEKDGEVTYAIGARALSLGVEIGSGADSSTGVDVLKFVNLPVISPYVGVGYYSEGKGIAFSGGVQGNATKNVFLGAGYHSIRGFNGQLGVKF
ncbi:hypothetical protein [Anabaena sp. PCC 7108]|uniref:hypothetical protein n=1 Tax=Anabaena sp. PCC 7108 TaxID=163908 RepID=UPI00034D5B5F|nr:hypothetical protein [Anabaena sp. PCC 7108]